ncbi:conserved hypothetical protein [Aspergillus udagawae]|uniref:Uncharacterized protein n=1 Tax=Aspergillus udagawae TaxID=91492 RepID=A0A8H3P2Y3_9EURO|nr:conserved hypothetical protein [Aspergillus udagawae]
MPRFVKEAPVRMQEAAEAIRRLIIYQGFHETFLTLMTPGTRYVEYLERIVPTTTAEPEGFIAKQSPDLGASRRRLSSEASA